ncbi:ion channel [Irpex rosettiformis]|uniref:Ion channel n=1 Tax=Irpex rosettiformis TaxID=378272 RepID=A0ACB8UKZ9_9APHY|nr:ion channel [Irpex rosettiformis]
MAGSYNGEDVQERLVDGGNFLVHRVQSAWSNFLDFLGRDNVLEVAVGLMIASSFTAVVTSLVSDVLLPPISLLPFMSHKNLPEKFAVLRKGPHGSRGYNTVEQAKEDGAVIMAYGIFLDKTLTFLSLGLVLYAIAQIYQLVSKDNIIKHTVRCPYCRKYIPEKAKRCVNCTSWVDGREEKETSVLHPVQE